MLKLQKQYINLFIFLGSSFLKRIFIGIYFRISQIMFLIIVFEIKLSDHSSLGKRSLLISKIIVNSSGIKKAI